MTINSQCKKSSLVNMTFQHYVVIFDRNSWKYCSTSHSPHARLKSCWFFVGSGKQSENTQAHKRVFLSVNRFNMRVASVNPDTARPVGASNCFPRMTVSFPPWLWRTWHSYYKSDELSAIFYGIAAIYLWDWLVSHLIRLYKTLWGLFY